MDEHPNEYQINKLLEDLRSETDYIRRAAVDKIVELGLTDERLIKSLKFMSANDPNSAVKNYARNALFKLDVEDSEQNLLTAASPTDTPNRKWSGVEVVMLVLILSLTGCLLFTAVCFNAQYN